MFYLKNYKLFISTLFFHAFVLPIALSSPIPNSPYDNFIHYIKENNCTMPKDLKLPFKETSDPSTFDYLYLPLNACRKPDRSKEFDEGSLLCTEIFDVLKNITCVQYNQSLSVIESDQFSENVCHDFGRFKNILPEKDTCLCGRLTDYINCNILCAEEKYDLCKILLWSYDTLMKINPSSLLGEKQVQINGNTTIDKDSSDKVTSSVKSELDTQNIKEPDDTKVAGSNVNTEEGNSPVSNLNEIDNGSRNNLKVSSDPAENASQATLNKKDLPDPQVQQVIPIDKTTSTNRNVATTVQQNKPEAENEQKIHTVSVNSVTLDESKNVPSMKPPSEHTHDTENDIDVTGKTSNKKVTDSQVKVEQINLTSNESGLKDKQSTKNVPVEKSQNNENYDVGSKEEKVTVTSKTDEKSAEAISPAKENDNELKGPNFPEEEKPKQTSLENPVDENDNELKGPNFPEEEKPKQTDVENQAGKEIGKPKQSDYESPNEVAPDIDAKLPEPTQSAVPDEDIEHQEDKDPEQYKIMLAALTGKEAYDMENDGDYAKPEYDLSSKNKAGVVHPLPVDSNQMPNSYGSNINPKENINRITEEIAMIAPFPEQEDSHFFFYFLSIVLIIMAGYLIFHNKQKIIALIVEGRHERRRRSHGAGYKKLDTK